MRLIHRSLNQEFYQNALKLSIIELQIKSKTYLGYKYTESELIINCPSLIIDRFWIAN